MRQFTSFDDPALLDLLMSGAVGVIPTDTVYGLVARAASKAAIMKLYQTKRRALPPGTMIGASIDDFARLGFPIAQLETGARFWPASLSVVVDAANVASYLKQNREALPVRIPSPVALRHLLEKTGPLMTTSANAPKQPTSTSIRMAIDYFGEASDFYLDGGDLSGRPPSTIVGFDKDNTLTVFRQGAVPVKLT